VVFKEKTSNIVTLLKMSKYLLKISLRYPLNFIADFFELALWVAIFTTAMLLFSSPETTFNGVSPASFALWGFVIYVFISDVLWSIGGGLRYDQITGILEQNFLAPINEYIYPLARLFRIYVRDIPLILFIPIAFWLFTGEFIAKNIFLSIYILIISVLGFIGFGYIYAAAIIHMKRSAIVTNIIQFLLMVFGAIFYPFSALPSQTIIISKLLPFSYYIDLFRATIIGITPELISGEVELMGFLMSPLAAELLITHVMTIILLIVGLKTYKYSIKVAKRNGTLHSF